MIRTLVSTLGVAGMLAVSACAGADTPDTVPSAQADGPMQGKEITVEIPADVPTDTMTEIARFVEAQGNVAAARVNVRKHGPEAPATMVIEVWGPDLGPVGFASLLREEFAALADAPIDELDLDSGGPSVAAEPMAASDAEDPEVARQEIVQKLRDQGVDGDIQVDVEDGPDGRRVEVKVHETRDAVATPK